MSKFLICILDAALQSLSKSPSPSSSQRDGDAKPLGQDIDFDWTKVRASFHLPKVPMDM